MLYLASPDGAPLTFPIDGSDSFIAFDGSRHATGKVAETTEAWLKRAADTVVPKAGADGSITYDSNHPFSFLTGADLMRDVRWIAKALAREHATVGAEGIGMVSTGRGMTITVPASAKPQRETYEPKVGDPVVINANISPRALINARGEIVKVNAASVVIKVTEGDQQRIKAATAKNFTREIKVPKACVERNADAPLTAKQIAHAARMLRDNMTEPGINGAAREERREPSDVWAIIDGLTAMVA